LTPTGAPVLLEYLADGPAARRRVTVSLKLTGWPYSLSSCFALSGL
jgi:hypothetical protein